MNVTCHFRCLSSTWCVTRRTAGATVRCWWATLRSIESASALPLSTWWWRCSSLTWSPVRTSEHSYTTGQCEVLHMSLFPHFSTNMLQWVTRRYTYRLLEVNNVVHQSINQSIAICRSLPNLGLKVKYRMFVQTTLHLTKVRIYDVNSRDHKEKTVNEKACPNYSMVVFVYFIHIILSIYTIHNTYISV